MEEGISEGNREETKIEYIPPGSQGELMPFMRPHTAHYVGMLLAAKTRRNIWRNAAVTHGTATTRGVPVSSITIRELVYYFQYLADQEEKEAQSTVLYLEFAEKKHTAETIMLRLKEDNDPEETKRLIQELDKITAQAQELAEQMEKLESA